MAISYETVSCGSCPLWQLEEGEFEKAALTDGEEVTSPVLSMMRAICAQRNPTEALSTLTMMTHNLHAKTFLSVNEADAPPAAGVLAACLKRSEASCVPQPAREITLAYLATILAVQSAANIVVAEHGSDEEVRAVVRELKRDQDTDTDWDDPEGVREKEQVRQTVRLNPDATPQEQRQQLIAYARFYGDVTDSFRKRPK